MWVKVTDMRINPGLGEQQSEWSVSGLQWKIVTDAVLRYFFVTVRDEKAGGIAAHMQST